MVAILTSVSSNQEAFDVSQNVNVPSTLGALLIGGLLATALSGGLTAQVIIYYKIYQDDSLKLKALVFVVWALDTGHTVFIWSSLWFYLIHHYGRPQLSDATPWTIGATVLFTTFVTCIVHGFYAHRIFLLSRRNWWLTCPIIVLTFVRLAFGCVAAEAFVRQPTFSQFYIHARWRLTLVLALLAGEDIMVTCILVYLLFNSRTRTASSVNDIVSILIQDVFKTGIIDCVGAVSAMICYIAMPHNLVFLTLFFTVAKLYANSLLAILNARQRLRHRRNPVTSDRTRPSNPLDDMNVKGSRGSGEGSGSVPSSEPSVANPEEPKSTFRNRANSINEHGISFADAENLPSSYDTTVHSIGSHHDPGVIPLEIFVHTKVERGRGVDRGQ